MTATAIITGTTTNPTAKTYEASELSLTFIAPQRPVADQCAGGSKAILPVDLADTCRAHGATINLNHPDDGIRIFRRTFQPLLLHLDRRRIAKLQKARGFEILEPGQHHRRVFRLGRPESNERPLNDRAVHGPKA
jgi:hypothetical protein